MQRSSLKAFIKSGVDSITPPLGFGSGLITDFNSERSHEYPTVWLALEKTASEENLYAPLDTWYVKLIIAQIDALDSKPDDYEALVDACDEVAQRLIYKYRVIVSGYKLITMVGVERERFVKRYADCLTGIELTFNIVSPDQSDFVC